MISLGNSDSQLVLGNRVRECLNVIYWLEQSRAWESGVVNLNHGTSPGRGL